MLNRYVLILLASSLFVADKVSKPRTVCGLFGTALFGVRAVGGTNDMASMPGSDSRCVTHIPKEWGGAGLELVTSRRDLCAVLSQDLKRDPSIYS